MQHKIELLGFSDRFIFLGDRKLFCSERNCHVVLVLVAKPSANSFMISHSIMQDLAHSREPQRSSSTTRHQSPIYWQARFLRLSLVFRKTFQLSMNSIQPVNDVTTAVVVLVCHSHLDMFRPFYLCNNDGNEISKREQEGSIFETSPD